MKINKVPNIKIFDVLVLFISTVSLVNVFLLAAGMFYPIWSLVASSVILCLGLLLARVKIVVADSRFHPVLIIILLLALLLRLFPNLYLTGGQDQGSYVALSKQYQVNQGLYIKDELRQSLSDKNKYWYDLGNDILGVKERNLEESEMVMPFYPVFPSWMAISGDLFGSDNRMWVLTFLSLISIVAIYLLGYELGGKDKKVGLLSSFLLALNPLHSYFSKVPVTETVYLLFFLLSLYYLMRYYNNKKSGKEDSISLGISLIAANASFYTRMNGIFILPIIVAIPVLVVIYKKKDLLLPFIKYSLIWIVTLFISFVYYSEFQPRLFNLIVVKRLLQFVNPWMLLLFSLIFLFFLIMMLLDRNSKAFLKKISDWIGQNIWWIAITVFSTLILYGLYFYVREIFINGGYSITSFESLSYFKQLSFLATLLYLTPIGFILIPIAFWYYRKDSRVEIKILISLIMIFLVYCWAILRLSQYHYYFVRYQLSELIPLSLLLISIFLINLNKKGVQKILLGLVLLIMSAYFGYYSVLQLRSEEGGNKESYEYIDQLVGEDDLLFVAEYEFDSFDQIVLPIKYYYDVNTFPLRYLSYVNKPEIEDLAEEFDDVYVLSAVPGLNRQQRERFEFVKDLDFEHNYFTHCLYDEDTFFEMEDHSPDIPFCEYMIIPNRYYYGTYRTYLYRWE